MGGKMPAAYWRDYRRRRATELREYNRQRRQQPDVKAQRHASEARRRQRIRAANPVEPLGILMPALQRGAKVAFWDDELRLDLAQEAALALIEGRDVREATEAYRQREQSWFAFAAPLFDPR